MKANKGFTLIELLAVIVVLAIIALIATPVVLNSISTARDGANKESARAFVKAAEFYCASKLLETPSVTVSGVVVTGKTGNQVNVADLGLKGTKPTALSNFTLDSSCTANSAATVTVGSAFTVSSLNS